MNKESGLAAVHAAAMSGASAAAIVANVGGERASATDDPAPPAATAPKMVGMTQTEYETNLSAANASGRADGAKAASARIKSIIAAPEAKGREQLAHSIAFDTELSHEQAVGMLKAAPEAQKVSRLDGHVPAPKVDASESGDASAPAKGLAAAVQKQIVKKFGAAQ